MTTRTPGRGQSLGTRITLVVFVMLVPLTAVVATGAFALERTVGSFERATGEATREAIPIVTVQASLGPAASTAFDAVVNGPQAGARDRAFGLVDRRFNDLLSSDELQDERPFVERAHRRWRHAEAVVEIVLTLSPAERFTVGLIQMQQFTKDVERASDALVRARRLAEVHIRNELASANAVHDQALILFVVMSALGVISGLVLSRRLSASVLRPLRRLRDGAERLGEGDLAHRIDPQSGAQQLEEVADAFNTMADDLDRGRVALQHQALHDPLTGLGNRTLLIDRIDHAMVSARRRRAGVALLVIDLDDFKQVNDTYGHETGDIALQALSSRLQAGLRSGDTVARLGGDEFALLVEDVRWATQPVEVAQRVLLALDQPLDIGGRAVNLRASIGVAVSADADSSASELLRNADLAMYRAKQQGKSRYDVYESFMHEEVVTELELESGLRRAIGNDELVVHYQPIVDLTDRRVKGVEALVRWEHPERGLIPPAAFIPLAERTGLVVPLGWWVLEQACGQVAHWDANEPTLRGLSLSVNLSVLQLQHPDLIDRITRTLVRTGLPPRRLTLEITETTVMDGSEVTARSLANLRALGVRIAIDDFGTGYSSLSYLQGFPMDQLKIDKSFVDALATNAAANAIVAAILSMATALGLDAVAEGIESEGQARTLLELGCQNGQGFMFSEPLPARELAAAAKTHESDQPTVPPIGVRS